jgi:hypothetical protein
MSSAVCRATEDSSRGEMQRYSVYTVDCSGWNKDMRSVRAHLAGLLEMTNSMRAGELEDQARRSGGRDAQTVVAPLFRLCRGAGVAADARNPATSTVLRRSLQAPLWS